jgi:starch-binding outer membrane protein, SusD/RagB family
MKSKYIKTLLGATLISMLLILMGCSSDMLTETPRNIYTPEYFQTTAGVEGGVTALYYNLRNYYGFAYYYGSCETGTDEATWGSSADGNFTSMDYSGAATFNADTYPITILWGLFSNINTANGIIENASLVNEADSGTIATSLIAEANFFRAFDYFLLVQRYGGVPLDLGAGELKFNTSPTRTSVRNTVPEVYTNCIFPDLLTAVEDLPSTQRLTGTVTKQVARLLLAKAYLTYAWWLENPNHIPSYPGDYTLGTETRTDPDGKTAAQYFQLAYDYAVNVMEDPGDYGLQSSFYDVNEGSNDRNDEIMLYADHTEESAQYSASSLTSASAWQPENFASWMLQWNYPSIRSSLTLNGTYGTSSVQRAAVQGLGRPWVRMAPPIGVFTTTFADKTNDSRYDGTFTSVYHGNWNLGGITNTYLYNANNLTVEEGDPILSFVDDDDVTVTYPVSGTANAAGTGTLAGYSNVGAGVAAGRADWVVGFNGISRIMYPGIWKIGPYRTDNGTGLGSPNAASTRPFPIDKFSEVFLIAAEAAVKGATTSSVTGTYATYATKSGTITNDGSAKALINIIRARAGKWSYSNALNATVSADYSDEMVAATPATIDIDYILAERSREYYGEGLRIFDLRRTQKWADVAGTYTICGKTTGDHTQVTTTRTINPGHYLDPIPQGQIDAMEMTDAEKTAYQNPEYQDE